MSDDEWGRSRGDDYNGWDDTDDDRPETRDETAETEIARSPEDESGPGPDGQFDPIQRALGGSTDLYDVATWDVRTRLDRFAVSLTAGL